MNEKEERKMKYILLMIVILSLFFVNFTSADVTSINSGGGEDVVINPDTYIEGFFSCVPYTCS